MHGHGVDQVKKHANLLNRLDIFKKADPSTISSFLQRETPPPHRNLKQRQQGLGAVCLLMIEMN